MKLIKIKKSMQKCTYEAISAREKEDKLMFFVTKKAPLLLKIYTEKIIMKESMEFKQMEWKITKDFKNDLSELD